MAVYSGLAARMGWVNIAAFGGDPGRVTVGGPPGGAVAAVTLLTSQDTLIHRLRHDPAAVNPTNK